jgi:hypothetical protein
MGELAAEIVDAANQSLYDRADLLEVAKTIVAKTDSRSAAELARVTWKPDTPAASDQVHLVSPWGARSSTRSRDHPTLG